MRWSFSSKKAALLQSLSCLRSDCLTVFPRGSWTTEEGLEPFQKSLQDPQPGPRSTCLLPNARVGQSLPLSLGIWCQIPEIPQRHCCQCVDARLFVVELGTEMRAISCLHGADAAFQVQSFHWWLVTLGLSPYKTSYDFQNSRFPEAWQIFIINHIVYIV